MSLRRVGRLARYVPLDTAGGINRVDAALMLFDQGVAATPTTLIGLGGVGPLATPANNMMVQKSGRTTGVKRGMVDDVQYDVSMPLHLLGVNGYAVFEDCIRVLATEGVIAAGGDSGSLFVTDDAVRRPVGLLFAAPPDGSYAIACDIRLVCQMLAVEIV